ncbi:MAG: hypothetical protein ABIK65_16295 [Candidatus Eisenbacteria bacterium]
MSLDDQAARRLYLTLLRSRGQTESPRKPGVRRAMLIQALRRKGLEIPEEKILPVAPIAEPADRLGRI